MVCEDLEGVEYEKTLCVHVGTGHRYFWSAIVEVQACGQPNNYVWLIFNQYKFLWVYFCGCCLPMKISPR